MGTVEKNVENEPEKFYALQLNEWEVGFVSDILTNASAHRKMEAFQLDKIIRRLDAI